MNQLILFILFLRYTIDSRFQIIIVTASIQLLAKKDVEFYIGTVLLKNLDIFTFLIYEFGAYNESVDTINISKLSKEELIYITGSPELFDSYLDIDQAIFLD